MLLTMALLRKKTYQKMAEEDAQKNAQLLCGDIDVDEQVQNISYHRDQALRNQ